MLQQLQQYSPGIHDTFHTSINMAETPLCAMQVLGNELLGRPDLLVVLQELKTWKWLDKKCKWLYDFAGYAEIIFPRASPKAGNSPQQPGEEQRNLHVCWYRRQWVSCRTYAAFGASFLHHHTPSRLLPLLLHRHGSFAWTPEHKRRIVLQAGEWHFTLFL